MTKYFALFLATFLAMFLLLLVVGCAGSPETVRQMTAEWHTP
jgi:hypothetical protein